MCIRDRFLEKDVTPEKADVTSEYSWVLSPNDLQAGTYKWVVLLVDEGKEERPRSSRQFRVLPFPTATATPTFTPMLTPSPMPTESPASQPIEGNVTPSPSRP